ncbi:MAG: hypothetical protein M3P15_11795 [Actinomycetota bacterium]|nr:hypothetical protein [Actinomycetota bacterium]
MSGLEPAAGRERHPPGCDLLRGQLADAAIAELGDRLAEQPAQLLDRHPLNVMLGEIGLDEFSERQCARNPPLAPHTFQVALKRVCRILLGRESAALHASRAAAR